MLADMPGDVVSVVSGANTAQGFVNYNNTADFGSSLKQQVSGTCRVIASDIGTLSMADKVKIGDRTVYVTDQTIDTMGVLNRFSFTSTNPATEVQ